MPGWIVDYEEDEIIVLARVAEAAYVGIRFILDYLMPVRQTLLIEHFSGIEMKTSIGGGPFSAIMMFTFYVSFITLKLKAPILPENKEEEQKKYKILFVIFVIVGIVHFGSEIVLRYFTSNIMDGFLVSSTLNVVVNYLILPMFFIYSIPNLRKYACKYFITNVKAPIVESMRFLLHNFAHHTS